MAKSSIQYVCSSCGAKSPQMLGRCPVCGEWGTYIEEMTSTKANHKYTSQTKSPQLLSQISYQEDVRIDMHCGELNRVLGGGLVPGSLVLLGGDPGIGKSTLALQVLMLMSDRKSLYASGEESAKQLKMRAERLEGDPKNLYILSETSLENILEQTTQIKPDIVVIDSIQTISTEGVDSTIGSLSQVRECAAKIMQYAKETNGGNHMNSVASSSRKLECTNKTIFRCTREQTYTPTKDASGSIEYVIDGIVALITEQKYSCRTKNHHKWCDTGIAEVSCRNGVRESETKGKRKAKNYPS